MWRDVLPKNQSKAHTDLKKLPASEKETVWVKKGTQLVDNVWRQLKLLGLPKSTKAEEAIVHHRIREAEAEADEWRAAGETLRLLYKSL